MIATAEQSNRERKAHALAAVLQRCMTPGTEECGDREPLTLDEVATRDTPEFWRLVRERAGVKPPSKPGSGIYAEISRETRALVLQILTEQR